MGRTTPSNTSSRRRTPGGCASARRCGPSSAKSGPARWPISSTSRPWRSKGEQSVHGYRDREGSEVVIAGGDVEEADGQVGRTRRYTRQRADERRGAREGQDRRVGRRGVELEVAAVRNRVLGARGVQE